MEDSLHKAVAIVGVGAILPDAPDVQTFWDNVKNGRYSITDVPSDRWNPKDYYDPDPTVPDKAYSKIGGWVREFPWEPFKWKLGIPPRVADAMDDAQKWAIACTREALEDYGYPKRELNLTRTAVILGNAMAGEKHYLTALRVYFPEYAHELEASASFAALPEPMRSDITRELRERIGKRLPPITEDSMPGELANCIAGRIANTFNFRGPNFVCDAACASAMAATKAAIDGLVANDFDAALTGGIDRNMGAPTFVKFCKIGALSATGSRPYAYGADGFVMAEGSALFILKRLADAERDGDKIYAVFRGIGASSDGKGKGITAPNPIGQKLAVERAWQNAGLSPATATMMEGHGTSTKVGDVVEVNAIAEVLSSFNLPAGSVALGSVKSNIGHLKGAAGAAGILKTALALHDKILPPTVNCQRPNPDIDFTHSPLFVNTELKPWMIPPNGVRRAGVSAFGFGGTNFHAVLEEHIPGRATGNGKRFIAVTQSASTPVKDGSMNASDSHSSSQPSALNKAPLRGALVLGAPTEEALVERLRAVQKDAAQGRAPAPSLPLEFDLRAPERIAIDYGDAVELADKCARALKALAANQSAMWKALRAQGIFRGRGAAPKVAFLYTGQGSQYVNMMKSLRASEPIVAETFAEADRVMTPLLGKPLSAYIFADSNDPNAMAKAEDDLRQTAITQPAVLATDISVTRLLAAYGIEPDMTMGHSLGEYGALVASGALPFEDALEAVSARGREMTRVSMEDNGRMAAVFAPIAEIERFIQTINGYVVIANINSKSQGVIGGSSKAVEQAIEAFQKAGFTAIPLPVSHAFHTSIVAPASGPLRTVLQRLRLQSPRIPIVANVNGEFYPAGQSVVPEMLDILAQQIAAPVQFVKGLKTLFAAGARVFIETGPKKALAGFVDDVLGDSPDVLSLFTNHPKTSDAVAFNQALCGLYASGLGRGLAEVHVEATRAEVQVPLETMKPVPASPAAPFGVEARADESRFAEFGRLFADVLERAWQAYHSETPPAKSEPVAITGGGLGLPGTPRVFDDENVARILRGEQLIGTIPPHLRHAMLDKNVTRLVKSDNGGPTFETINDVADVIKLAGRAGAFDLESEFGVSADRIPSFDSTTRLAIAAGLEAMRDAGIPLVMRYRTTSKGTQLPDGWGLPDAMRDDTGIIFASAFPGFDALTDEITRYHEDRTRREELAILKELHARANAANNNATTLQEIEVRIASLRSAIQKQPYAFDRRFLFKALSMGHSQFAELIGARGPNTQINSACASTAQAVALAEDWIRAGRCRRAIIVSADNATSDNMMGWIGAGFLATGAAATDEAVDDAAIPFDRRRHGMVVGMGAAALVVESAEAARERGITPICEVLSTVTANSAFHGTRLDIEHISRIMERLVAQAEFRHGISRHDVAPKTVFVSHETYTPARGGSASAEIYALRRVFARDADHIVIANTKGLTGHAMGTGIEDVVAVKVLETGVVPPVVNFKEVDPDLGQLNLSKGGSYPVDYAIHLGAGFGSQISMTLLRWVKTKDGVRRAPNALGYAYRIADQSVWSGWLSRMTGYSTSDLEVVQRTLRVRDQKAVARAEAAKEVRPAASAVVPIPAPAPVTEAVAPPQATAIAASQPIVTPTPVVAAQEAATAPVPPTPTARTFPAASAPVSADSVKERVLTLVSEKTGYPIDMLDLDLDLEADLGVDTVKQAEVMASIREVYGIARDYTIRLRDFPTLGHVIRFVHDRRPDSFATAVASQDAPAKPAMDMPLAPPPKAEPLASESVPAAVFDAVRPADDVKERILALVVEKTGYPPEMLDLDLDLEADLGVDTVKQAELLAAIREIYSIPRDPTLKLRDFPTLKHVIQFVYDRRPDMSAASERLAEPTTASFVEPPAPMAAAPSASEPAIATPAIQHPTEQVPVPAKSAAVAAISFDEIKEKVLAIVSEKTGYPIDMLDLDLDLEADLGVDTVKQAEMLAAVRGSYNIPRDENLKLRDFPTLKHVIQFAYDRQPALTSAQPVAAPHVETTQPVAAPPAAATPTVTMDEIKEKVLAIVSEKTGYPTDMLDLDLDLEADLGVDTVKQAEMLAAVRGAYNIPRDENLKLRDFPTLAHVIQFAQERIARPATETAPPAPVAPSDQEPKLRPVLVRPQPASFEAADRIPRRVPTPVLRPPITICKPTGVTLAAGNRVIIMPDVCGVADELAHQLRVKDVQTLLINHAWTADQLAASLQEWLAAGPVQGVYWISSLDHEGAISTLDIRSWRESLRIRLKSLYVTMRALYDQIAAPGTFLISATRLGGQHGYDEAGAVAPMGGAVVGFTKTYKRERPDATVKAIDFEANRAPSDVARILIDETLRDPGAVEVGYKSDLRWTIALAEQPAIDGQPGLTLDQSTVFVVTGAAGSIVSAITADLASASGGTFYLLDLVPRPDPDNPDLKKFATDKDGLKRDIFARIQASGQRATPALVEKELADLERACAAQSAIDAVQKAGGTAHYFSVNLIDADAVAKVIDEIRQRSGRIDVLLHAAGMERSHFLPDKDQREFALVFDVKSDGWFNLLHAIDDMPLGATVAFSSIAGRFGNAGQADYASANDLLCKYTSSFRSTRPSTRGIVIDWTAWGGIGMATRGSIPKMMEVAGIDMLPPEAGVPAIRRELTVGGTRGEVLVGQRLGILLNEWDTTGGIDTALFETLESTEVARGPMIGRIAAMAVSTGLVIETTLDPKVQPFLHDHQIDGTPVLPGAMGIEAFAEAARCVLPGWRLDDIEHVSFLAPFKFYRNEPRTVTIEAVFHPQGDGIVAECRLIGRRQLPNQPEPQITTHFTARVRLTKRVLQPVTVPAVSKPAGRVIDSKDIYRVYFHGPAYRVLDRAWQDGKRIVGQMPAALPSNHQPEKLPTIMAPRLIELCFQTAGLWELTEQGRMGLPQVVDQVSLLRAPEPGGGPLYAVVNPSPNEQAFNAQVVDSLGNVYVEMSGYRTVAIPNAVDEDSLKSLKAAA